MNIVEFAKFKKMVGGGSNGNVTRVTTEAEMDSILSTATDDMVGRCYLYCGETTEKFWNEYLVYLRKKIQTYYKSKEKE